MPQHRNAAATRETPPNAGKPWSVEEERALHAGFWAPGNVRDLSARHGRTNGGIRARLRKLGLLDDAGISVEPKPKFHPSTRRSSTRPVPEQVAYPEVTQHCDDAQLLELFYRLSMGQRANALGYIRGLVANLDQT